MYRRPAGSNRTEPLLPYTMLVRSAAVGLAPPVFERPDVGRAGIAGVGGIFNARDEARFWAMLAGGGALDGVRLLAADRVASFSNIRDNGDEPDQIGRAHV